MGYALNSGRGWTGDLIIACWDDFENNVASEVHVERFNFQEVGVMKLQEAFICPCTDGSLREEGHAQRHTFLTPPEELRASTRRENPRVEARRGEE